MCLSLPVASICYFYLKLAQRLRELRAPIYVSHVSQAIEESGSSSALALSPSRDPVKLHLRTRADLDACSDEQISGNVQALIVDVALLRVVAKDLTALNMTERP